MEIIKPGDPERLKQTKIFKCPRCGCEFKADKGEYIIGDMWRNMQTYTCYCPTCDYKVYLEE